MSTPSWRTSEVEKTYCARHLALHPRRASRATPWPWLPGGARNPHVFQHTLRLLVSSLRFALAGSRSRRNGPALRRNATFLSFARDGFFTTSRVKWGWPIALGEAAGVVAHLLINARYLVHPQCCPFGRVRSYLLGRLPAAGGGGEGVGQVAQETGADRLPRRSARLPRRGSDLRVRRVRCDREARVPALRPDRRAPRLARSLRYAGSVG